MCLNYKWQKIFIKIMIMTFMDVGNVFELKSILRSKFWGENVWNSDGFILRTKCKPINLQLSQFIAISPSRVWHFFHFKYILNVWEHSEWRKELQRRRRRKKNLLTRFDTRQKPFFFYSRIFQFQSHGYNQRNFVILNEHRRMGRVGSSLGAIEKY